MIDHFIKFINEYLMIAAIIIFGATANALAQLSHARKQADETFDWVDFIIALVISAFSGTLFGIVATHFYTDPAVVHGIAGVGAFLGLKGLNKLSEVVITYLENRSKK